MKDLEILAFLKVLQSNKDLILEKVSGTEDYVKIQLENIYFETDAGICGNMWRNLTFNCDLKNEYLESWKHYSGCKDYPVGGEEVYDSLENYWLGEQAKLRFDLIDHLIKCYSEQLRGAK